MRLEGCCASAGLHGDSVRILRWILKILRVRERERETERERENMNFHNRLLCIVGGPNIPQ